MGNIVIGLIFIVGGLSGTLALIGTNSGTALAVVGVLLLGRGVWRIPQTARPAGAVTMESQGRSPLRPCSSARSP